MKNLAFVFAVLCVCFGTSAQTILNPGDLAVIAHNNDDPDQIILVAITHVSQGTVISLTDNAWTGTSLNSNEGTWTYTFPAPVDAGSRIILSSTSTGVVTSGSLNLSTSGDQIFVYQGNAANPSFIYGFSSRAWVTGKTGTTTSRLPSALINGITARDFASEVDNGYYNVSPTTGTREEILSAIGITGNWTRSNTRYSSFPSVAFTVINSLDNEPASQPGNFTSSEVYTWSFNVNWTAGFPACDGYLVLRADGNSPVNGEPADGVVYQIGDQVGNAKVAYVGNGNSFNQRGGIGASETQHYAVFAYNGSAETINYRQTSPLTGSVTTPATGEGDYYSGINPLDSSFVTALQDRVRNPFTSVDYGLYDETVVSNFAFSDTTAGGKVATCAYSGERVVYTPPFAWIPVTPFSREHTWCYSWMPSHGSVSTDEYADYHHLFVVNQNEANAVRSNRPLGDVVSVISSYYEGIYGLNTEGHRVYEPRGSHKGDAARALLYMTLRYNGINGDDWTFDWLNNVVLPSLDEAPQDVQLLLQWHYQDPPDGWEIARNDYIQSIQGNRNPFIDHPEWVEHLNFNTFSYKTSRIEQESIVEETRGFDISSYPNPFTDDLSLRIESTIDSFCRLRIISSDGRDLYQSSVQVTTGDNSIDLSGLNLPSGLSILIVEMDGKVTSQKILKVGK